jgi:hypothetical protein
MSDTGSNKRPREEEEAYGSATKKPRVSASTDPEAIEIVSPISDRMDTKLDLHNSDRDQVEEYMKQQDKLPRVVFEEPEASSRRDLKGVPDRKRLVQYRQKAAQHEEWMEDPSAPGCPVTASTLTYDFLINNDNAERRFQITGDEWTALEPGFKYHAMSAELPISKDSAHSVGLRRELTPGSKTDQFFEQVITQGAIVGESIHRNGWGPHWSDVALAVYKYHHPIDTLKCIFFTGVVNSSTEPLITGVIYPNWGLPVPERGVKRVGLSATTLWRPNLNEFYEIMGSALGKSAASIVLGAWPRGTHHISAIWTWFDDSDLQIRFDIQPIQPTRAAPAPPAAPAPAAAAAPAAAPETGKSVPES